jgi:hypothetical protein
MSTVITAAIDRIETRVVNTKFGPKTAYTGMLTDGRKLQFNFKNPATLGVTAPATINAEVEEGKYGLEFKGLSSGAPSTASTTGLVAKPTGAGASGRPFPVPVNSGEMAIIRQNALTNAVNWFNRMPLVTEDADGNLIPPPSDADMAERIIAMAYRFAEFSSGQREVRVVDEMDGPSA